VTPSPSANSGRYARRAAALVLVALLGSVLPAAAPAAAAGPVGYVRLAHLSPDTPDVDVYLAAVTGGTPQRFPGVGYGTVSTYLSVPTGTYAVSMRGAGAPATDPPVLTTNVTVADGKAYTVAGVGKHADLGLKVIDDDLSLPPAGKAKVRIVQASVRAPVMTVSIAGGPVIADNIAFATTTDYLDVTPGHWTLKAQGAGGSPSSTLTATLATGNVYSLIVLDAKTGNGLTAQLARRRSAHRHGTDGRGGHRCRRYQRPEVRAATGRRGRAVPDRRRRAGGAGAATPGPGTVAAVTSVADRRRRRGFPAAVAVLLALAPGSRSWPATGARATPRPGSRRRRAPWPVARPAVARRTRRCPPRTRSQRPVPRRPSGCASPTSAWTHPWSSCTCCPTVP